VLHATFSKDNAIRAISNLGGNIIFVDSNYQKYQLTIIGIFLSEHGVMYERLIHDYLKYIRKRFYEDPELEQIKCEEIESAFNLDKDQSRLLNRLILLGHFWGGSAGGGDNWTVGLPTDIDEIPEDINEYLQGYIKRRYDLSYGKSKVPTQNTLLRDVNMDIAVAVFVIHGRNKKLRDSMFSFLRSIGLQPIEWSQAVKLTGKASPFIGEVLDAAFNNAQAVVALLSPDDEARLLPLYQNPNDEGYEKNLTPQPRPNVLFETGMAFGNNPDRTVIVQIGRLRPFSDIQGRHVLRFDGSSEMRLELCNRLETAGCVVNRSGSDWLSVGDFDIEQINNVNISEDVKSENLSNDLLLKKISLSEKYKIEWSLERESTIADVKIGKRIMAKVNNNLLELVTSYQNEISEDIRTKIQKILSDIKAIEKIRIYADGGLSYRTFWESGDLVFKKLASIEWI
jgi:predicted nucleotide-binding protein